MNIDASRWILTIFRRSTKIHRQFPMKGGLIHRAIPFPSSFECCPTFSYFFFFLLPIDKRVTLIFPRCILDSGGKKKQLEKKWPFPFETRLFDTLMLFRSAMSEIVLCFFCLEKRRVTRRKMFREDSKVRGEGRESKTTRFLSYNPGSDTLNSLFLKE